MVVFLTEQHNPSAESRGALVGPSGRLLGLSWPLLGFSWPLLGLSWGRLGRSWASLGRSWATPGPSWPALGASWASLGASWAALGSQQRVLAKSCSRCSGNTIFKVPGAQVGPKLAPSWHQMGPKLAQVAPQLALERRFGQTWASSWLWNDAKLPLERRLGAKQLF